MEWRELKVRMNARAACLNMSVLACQLSRRFGTLDACEVKRKWDQLVVWRVVLHGAVCVSARSVRTGGVKI